MKKVDFTVVEHGFPGMGTNRRGFGWSSCALVTSDQGNMMIDTGSYSSRATVLKVLKEKGLTPSDIRYVLLTHLHHDHIQNIDLFPQAEFLMAEKEWIYAVTTTDRPYQKTILVPLLFYRKRFVQDGEQIVPGVTAFFTPGHTHGSVSYLIEADSKIMFAGDAIKNRVELCLASVDMTYDNAQSVRSIERIIQLSDQVMMGHDGIYQVKDRQFREIASMQMNLQFREGMTCNGGAQIVTAAVDDAVSLPDSMYGVFFDRWK